MKSFHRIIQIVLIVLASLYSYMIVQIDYTGTGWMVSGMITLRSTAIIAMWLVVGLILYEGINTFKSKNLPWLIPLFYFCISINFSFAGDQMAFHYPVFLFARIGIFALFIGGAIVATIMLYLAGFDNFRNNNPTVVLGAPLLFFVIPFFIFGAIAYVTQNWNFNNLDLTFDIFPNFGDWTAGSVIIAWVMFSFYLGVRMLDPSVGILFRKIKLFRMKFTEEEINSVGKWDYFKIFAELFITYTAISAGFSLSGIGLTDGTPPVGTLPPEIIPISFLTIIPFLLLVSRKSIFGVKNSDLMINSTATV